MKILGEIPKDIYLACSGGIDSMAILNFLLSGNRNVTLLYFNHNTTHGHEAEKFLIDFCANNNLQLHIGYYKDKVETEESWRNARYDFFSNFKDKPIITCHHLDDNIETFLLGLIRGNSKLIPYSRGNVIRPFLLVSKEKLKRYVSNKNIIWCEDPSNAESFYSRNKIRNQVIPVLKEINPGLSKVFYNKCLFKYQNLIKQKRK